MYGNIRHIRVQNKKQEDYDNGEIINFKSGFYFYQNCLL